MEFIESIGGLLVSNIEFNNDSLEAAVEEFGNKVAAVTKAGVEFAALAGEKKQTQDAGEALITLAGEFGTAFPNLDDEAVTRIKALVASVYNDPDPEIDAAGEKLFNTAVDAVIAAKILNREANKEA